MTTGKVTLGYWKIRGLVANLRYQAIYSDIEINQVDYVQGPGPEFSRDAWMSVKHSLGFDFPNLPYLIDGETKLTETSAIHYYLAQKYDPALIGTSPEQMAKVQMLMNIVGQFRSKLTGPCYSSGDHEALKKAWDFQVPLILKAKGSNKFLAGDNVTIVDFLFFEAVEFLKWASKGEIFNEHPQLKEYSQQVKSLKNLKEYFQSADCWENDKTFNNVVAKINGTQSLKEN